MRLFLGMMLACALMAENAAQPDFAAEFARRWTATRKLAVGVAEAMPSEQYAFKPDPPSMNFGELMSHIAWGNYAFCAALKDEKTPDGKAPDGPTSTDKAAIARYIADSFDYCSTQIAGVTNAQMDAIHRTPDGRLTGRETLLALYVHMAHHRGQAEIYLRIKGIAPPPYVF